MEKLKYLKAQAAMEYLMQYGWALLVIVIVLASLTFLFNSNTDNCLFDSPPFLCQGQRLVSEDSNGLSNVVYADITYGGFQHIQIIGMACTSGKMPKTSSDGNFADPLFRMPKKDGLYPVLSSGQKFNTGLFENGFRLQCVNVDSEGNIATVDGGRPQIYGPGENFAGKIYLAYKGTDEGVSIPPKITGAILTTSVN